MGIFLYSLDLSVGHFQEGLTYPECGQCYFIGCCPKCNEEGQAVS